MTLTEPNCATPKPNLCRSSARLASFVNGWIQ
jgi:hypothetical protein